MGIKPKVIVAPSAVAEFQLRGARLQNAFAAPAMQNFIGQVREQQNKLKLALEQSETYQSIQALKAAFDNSGIGQLVKQIRNTFVKAKTWLKEFFVKYLPIALPLWQIPRAQIQPSSDKSFWLPNSYRSHSPPIYSMIK